MKCSKQRSNTLEQVGRYRDPKTSSEAIVISVLTRVRYNYLFICLDAIFRMNGIESCPVHVMVNGYRHEDMIWRDVRRGMMKAASRFPVDSVMFWRGELSILHAHIKAFELGFATGADWVLLIEDDIIVKTSGLDFFRKAIADYKIDGCFLNSGRYEPEAPDTKFEYKVCDGYYHPWGSGLSRAGFLRVKEWVASGEYLKLPFDNSGKAIGELGADTIQWVYDGAFLAICKQEHIAACRPTRNLSAHIGIRPENVCLYSDIRDALIPARLPNHEWEEAEAFLFSGPKDRWLMNAVALLNNDKYLDVCRDYKLAPRHFNYM